jgi:hypothetical protein
LTWRGVTKELVDGWKLLQVFRVCEGTHCGNDEPEAHRLERRPNKHQDENANEFAPLIGMKNFPDERND